MKKIIASLMSLALILSMCCITAFATEITNSNSVTVGDGTTGEESTAVSNSVMTFTTSLLMSETAITAPEVDFTYTTTSSDEELSDGTVVLAGVINEDENGNTTAPTITTTAFTTKDFVAPSVTDEQYIVKDVTVDFSDIVWTTTGIYHYTITADDLSSVDGVVMDGDTTRDIYVYVLEDTDKTVGTYYIANIIMTTDPLTDTTVTDIDTAEGNTDIFYQANVSSDGTKSEGFENGYGVDPDTDPGTGDDPDKVYEDFIVTLEVEGNMADRNKDFTITLTADSNTISTGTIFTVTTPDGTSYIAWNGSQFVTATYTAASWTYAEANESAEDYSFTLKDSETYTIHSVVENMKITTTITEEDNYTISSYMDADTQPDIMGTGLELENTIETQETTNINDSNNYVPKYDLTIPDTGILLDFLPFVLIVLIPAGIITVRVVANRRKNAK